MVAIVGRFSATQSDGSGDLSNAGRIRFGSIFYLLDRFIAKMDELSGLDQIELGMPPSFAAAKQIDLQECIDRVRSTGPAIRALHFPHLPITHPGFLPAARQMAAIAVANDIPTITVHPHRCNGDRIGEQRRSLNVLLQLREQFGELFCIECFDEPNRCLQPLELGRLDLPIVVDAAHMCAFDLPNFIAAHRRKIRNLHTSFCRAGRDRLVVAGLIAPPGMPQLAFLRQISKNWHGNVFFEHESGALSLVKQVIEVATGDAGATHRENAQDRDIEALLNELAVLVVRPYDASAKISYRRAQAAIAELECAGGKHAEHYLAIGQMRFLAGRAAVHHGIVNSDAIRRDFIGAVSALKMARQLDVSLHFVSRREIRISKYYLSAYDRNAVNVPEQRCSFGV